MPIQFDQIRLSKIDAARRQLRVGIRLFFDGGDPVAIHTLIGAASMVISDLAEHQNPIDSWDRVAQKANELKPGEYFHIMRAPQNFIKHAKKDPDAELDFNPAETLDLAFSAAMNLFEFGPLRSNEFIFLMWFLACRAPKEVQDAKVFQNAFELFGDLRNLPCEEQVSIGKDFLDENFEN